ncbi:NUDIX hydrolase [Novosphingobium sp. BL-8H]|uniref:NUDIX hydrolase n=1 Tax=Novosphingobium sp. BL-8H TaxID=3127640 RepID=UPI0037568CCD
MKKVQSAAIPYRCNDKNGLEFLLVTSRRKGRWVLPRGTVGGLLPHASAAREALEEAGALGDVSPSPFGVYDLLKRVKDCDPIVIPIHAFPLRVRTQLEVWPETNFRRRRWVIAGDAAGEVTGKQL